MQLLCQCATCTTMTAIIVYTNQGLFDNTNHARFVCTIQDWNVIRTRWPVTCPVGTLFAIARAVPLYQWHNNCNCKSRATVRGQELCHFHTQEPFFKNFFKTYCTKSNRHHGCVIQLAWVMHMIAMAWSLLIARIVPYVILWSDLWNFCELCGRSIYRRDFCL